MKGIHGSVLEHAPGCDGQEFSKLQAVARQKHSDPASTEEEIVVVRMDWCGDCSASEWEFV